MKLQIPLTEATSLVKEKTGQDVALEIINSNTVKLGYKLKVKVPLLGEVSKNIDGEVSVEKIDGETLYLKYDAGIGIDMILKGLIIASPALGSKQIIEPLDGNRLKVNLGEVGKVHGTLKKVTIKDICFANDNAEVEFSLKTID